MYGYIYKTTNLLNGKIYIGQHTESKFNQKYLGSGLRLKDSIRKHGRENFKVELIEKCDSYEELNNREKYWISFFNSENSKIGYNLCAGGVAPRYDGENHPMYGRHHSNESKEKNRQSHLGKICSEETKRKIGMKQKGKVISQEQRMAISMAMTGKHLSDEHKRKISEANMGRKQKPVCEETREKLRKANLGKQLTEETRRKMSESHKGKFTPGNNKHRSEETKRRLSEAWSNKPRLYRRKKIQIDDKFFLGLDELAKYYNMTKSNASLWVKRGFTKDGKIIKVM